MKLFQIPRGNGRILSKSFSTARQLDTRMRSCCVNRTKGTKVDDLLYGRLLDLLGSLVETVEAVETC